MGDSPQTSGMTDNEKDIWVFISHSNKDFEQVRKVRNYLEEHSCRPLLFYLMCLSDDAEIDQLIKREIDCRTRFIFCESAHSRTSRWVQSEIAYMKSSRKNFTTIDLSKPDNIIQKELDKFLQSIQAYFLYSNHEAELAQDALQHVSKYDIRCRCCSGTGSAEGIIHSGFVVVFASGHSLNDPAVQAELAVAATHHIPILALSVDDYAAEHSEDFFLSRYGLKETFHEGGLPNRERLERCTITGSSQPLEAILEQIVNKALPCWDTYALALKFREGGATERNEEEAERLFRIAYNKAYILAWADEYPGGFLYLAKCYDFGHGTPRNPHAALHFYKRLQRYGGLCEGAIARLQKELGGE